MHPTLGLRLCWSLTCPCPCLVPRLRSVKIEQGKVNDQANTLAELAKVSVSRMGEGHGNSVYSGEAGNPQRSIEYARVGSSV